MSLVDVGGVDDFPSGLVSVVSVDGKEIGILSWRGSWYAVRNICPHLGAPLCAGSTRAFLTQERAASPDLTVDLDRPVIECPWHHWEFDVRSGTSIVGNEKVKTYPVQIDGDRVLVDLLPGATQPAPTAIEASS
jgi:nitrite reductase (NADH) small subunit